MLELPIPPESLLDDIYRDPGLSLDTSKKLIVRLGLEKGDDAGVQLGAEMLQGLLVGGRGLVIALESVLIEEVFRQDRGHCGAWRYAAVNPSGADDEVCGSAGNMWKNYVRSTDSRGMVKFKMSRLHQAQGEPGNRARAGVIHGSGQTTRWSGHAGPYESPSHLLPHGQAWPPNKQSNVHCGHNTSLCKAATLIPVAQMPKPPDPPASLAHLVPASIVQRASLPASRHRNRLRTISWVSFCSVHPHPHRQLPILLT